jgi:hypothetical protein
MKVHAWFLVTPLVLVLQIVEQDMRKLLAALLY